MVEIKISDIIVWAWKIAKKRPTGSIESLK